MSISGPPIDLVFAFIEILVSYFFAGYLALRGKYGLATAIVLVVFLSFKHGFVRHDGHELRFFFSMPILVAVEFLELPKSRIRQITYPFYFFTLGVCIYSYSSHLNSSDFLSGNFFSALSPTVVKQKLVYFIHPFNLIKDLESKSLINLQGLVLPEEKRQLLQNKSVDILPWEISLVAANKLNWKPRPVFQSQAAYTTYLDRLNESSLATKKRDYILYKFISIDGRHPFFDEPATLFHILCNYQFHSSLSLKSLKNLMILQSRSKSVCNPHTFITPFQKLTWGEELSLPLYTYDFLRASIFIEYSLLGKIIKSFFKIPPVGFTVTYADNSRSSYRILIENATNGVMISYLPRTHLEAMELLSYPQKINFPLVRSLQLDVKYKFLFKKDISLQFLGNNLFNKKTSQ